MSVARIGARPTIWQRLHLRPYHNHPVTPVLSHRGRTLAVTITKPSGRSNGAGDALAGSKLTAFLATGPAVQPVAALAEAPNYTALAIQLRSDDPSASKSAIDALARAVKAGQKPPADVLRAVRDAGIADNSLRDLAMNILKCASLMMSNADGIKVQRQVELPHPATPTGNIPSIVELLRDPTTRSAILDSIASGEHQVPDAERASVVEALIELGDTDDPFSSVRQHIENALVRIA